MLGGCSVCLPDTSRRGRGSALPVWNWDQTDSSHNQLTGQEASLSTPPPHPHPPYPPPRSSPLASRPKRAPSVRPSVSITVGQSGRELTRAWQREGGWGGWGGKKSSILSVRRLMAEGNITLSNRPGTALKVCGRVHMCIRARLS